MVAQILLSQSCMHLAVRVWQAFKIVRELQWRGRAVVGKLPYCQGRLEPGQEAGRSLSCG